MSADALNKTHGQRMRKLQNAFHVTVKYALRGVPPDEFHAYFPEGPLPNEIIETAYDGYSQCLHQARVVIETDFEEVCEESSIANKLQTLDIMCAEQGIVDGKPDEASVPAGPPPTKAARVAAFRAKQEEAARLTAILEEVQRREAAAEAELEQKKKAAMDLVAAAAPVQAELADIQAVAASWVNRGSTPAAATTPAAT